VAESGVLLRDGQDGIAVLTNRAVFDDDQRLAGGCSITDDGAAEMYVRPAEIDL